MKKNYIFYVIIVLVLFLFNSADADRKTHKGKKKHFAFNVPVEINNSCESMDSVKVQCIVSSRVNSTATQYLIGRREKTFDFNGRQTLRFTARISFDADPGKNPLDAIWWKVSLKVRKTGTTMYYEPSSLLGVFPNCVEDESKPYRPNDSGRIYH